MKFRLNENAALTEMSNGGQRTFKLFLCELINEFIGDDLDADRYHLHHIDGNHENNKMGNLVLMLAKDHRSLHGKVKGKDDGDYKDRLVAAFETMSFTEQPYYVDRCLKHIFGKLTNGLGSDAIADDNMVEQKMDMEENIN